MAKAKDAFRTISEVSDWLDTPAHVLRFWESKFNQIKPVKRAGGRRYYRPDDMMLLAGIKTLLHEDGLTIKGAQKLLREKGVKHVQGLSPLRVGEDEEADAAAAVAPAPEPTVAPRPEPQSEPVADELPLDEPAASDPGDTSTPAPDPAQSEEPAPAAAMPPPTSRPAHFTPPAREPSAPALALLQDADAATLRDQKARISALLDRMEELRDSLRAG